MARFCVFCGANPNIQLGNFISEATKLGQLLAKHQHDLVYGGGSKGLMGTVASSCLASGGKVFGVMPYFLKDLEVLHPGLTEVTLVNDLMERKKQMMALSDAFIILPGGAGTMDEFSEVLSTFQLRLHNKAIYVLNIDGYYNHLFSFLKHTHSVGFLPKVTLDAMEIHQSADSLFAALHPNK